MIIKNSPCGYAFLILTFFISKSFANPSSTLVDSLAAFKSDSALADPFQKVESGAAAFGTKPSSVSDTGSKRTDSVTALIKKRRPGVSLYLGIDFIDHSSKTNFQNSLIARDSAQGLNTLQGYEPVHLTFPVGLEVNIPLSPYLDWVVKFHSYWYKQTAILQNSVTKTPAGDEWFVVQGNLVGTGIKYCIPPALLSVTGQLGLTVQGIWYWNLGNSEMYTRYGNAKAEFGPLGSGYEIQLGFQQEVTKPWTISGGLGFLHQEYASKNSWGQILKYSAPTGSVDCKISAISVTINLWYYFGVIDAPKR